MNEIMKFIDLFDGYVQPYINDEKFLSIKTRDKPKFIITALNQNT
jgi:hypothetical protein